MNNDFKYKEINLKGIKEIKLRNKEIKLRFLTTNIKAGNSFNNKAQKIKLSKNAVLIIKFCTTV